ncbi:hypothetical protein I4U23_005532 [Adineta vaga]|nr:hypothetical protein I4U23_005532 [Adineta vaga]
MQLSNSDTNSLLFSLMLENMNILCLFVLTTIGVRIDANVNVKVMIKQPFPAEFQSLESAIHNHITTAIQDWSSHFETAPCTLDVEFSLQNWANRGGGRSFASVNFENQDLPGKIILDQGASYEMRTGIDPNGEGTPDIEIFFDPIYFRTLWFDPDPTMRTATMPNQNEGKLDAYSVILHELGHALGFNGFLSQTTGQMTGNYLSVYDRWVNFDGRNFFFNGPNTLTFYGRPVILAHTKNGYHHVGEFEDMTDPNLAQDLMNGFALEYSHRYYISLLDVAILLDCGMTLQNTNRQNVFKKNHGNINDKMMNLPEPPAI